MNCADRFTADRLIADRFSADRPIAERKCSNRFLYGFRAPPSVNMANSARARWPRRAHASSWACSMSLRTRFRTAGSSWKPDAARTGMRSSHARFRAQTSSTSAANRRGQAAHRSRRSKNRTASFRSSKLCSASGPQSVLSIDTYQAATARPRSPQDVQSSMTSQVFSGIRRWPAPARSCSAALY